MKPGYRTTEFWLTLVAVVANAVAQSGLLEGDSAELRIVTAIAAGLAAMGYSISRGIAKKPLVVLLALLMLPMDSVVAQEAKGSRSVGLHSFEPNTTYTLRITTDGEGRIAEIVRVNPMPLVSVPQLPLEDPSDAGNPPPQPPATGLQRRVSEMVASLDDPETARNLAVGYSVILLSSDYSSVLDIGTAASQARLAVLSDRGVADKWQPFGDLLVDEFSRAAQEGRLRTVEEYKALLQQVRDGLVANRSGEFRIGDMVRVVQLVLESISDKKLTLSEVLQIAVEVAKILGGL